MRDLKTAKEPRVVLEDCVDQAIRELVRSSLNDRGHVMTTLQLAIVRDVLEGEGSRLRRELYKAADRAVWVNIILAVLIICAILFG